MTRLMRKLAFLVLAGVLLIPPSAAAAPIASCEDEVFACGRKQWDFWGCTDSCTALLMECMDNCGMDAPESWGCSPPGPYSPPNKKDGWCYCYTGPCSG